MSNREAIICRKSARISKATLALSTVWSRCGEKEKFIVFKLCSKVKKLCLLSTTVDLIPCSGTIRDK